MATTKNFAKVTANTTYDASATSVLLTTGGGGKLPSTTPFWMTWWDSGNYPDPSDDPNAEIVKVTAKVSDTLTVVRAQQGTSATTKNTAGTTYSLSHSPTSYDFGYLWSVQSGTNTTIYLDASNGEDASAQANNPFRPYLTISAAFAALTSNTTLVIRDGTYTVTPSVYGPGVNTAPLKILDLTNVSVIGHGRVIISGTGNGNYLSIENSSFIHIENIEFKGDGPWIGTFSGNIFAMIHILDEIGGGGAACHDLSFKRCKFIDYRDHGIAHLFSPRSTYNVTVTECYFTNGGNLEAGTTNTDGAAVVSLGSNVIVSNNTFKDTMRGVEVEGAGPQRNWVVTGNVFEELWEQGFMIFATSGNYTDYQGITVSNNVFKDINPGNAPVGMSASLNAVAASTSGYQDLVFSGNTIQDCQFGLGFYPSSAHAYNCIITSNTIQNCGARPFTLYESHTYGFNMKNLVVSNNVIHSSGQDGMHVRGRNINIVGNVITNAGTYAIRFVNSGAAITPLVRISNNIITQIDGNTAQLYGVRIDNEFTGINVIDNDLSGNTTGGIEDLGTSTVDRTNVT